MQRSMAVLLVWVLGLAAAVAGEPFWAQATYVRGEVSWQAGDGGETQALRRGAVLHRGDVVCAGDGSQASFLLADGSIVVVRAGHTVTLGSAERPARPGLTVVASNLGKTLLAREGDNPMLKHLGALRASERNIALAPCQTAVQGPVHLVWAPWPGVASYAVTVMGPDDAVLDVIRDGTDLELAQDQLVAGATYYWEVRDAAARNTFTALGSGSFTTLESADVERVRTMEKAIADAFPNGDRGDDSTSVFLTYQVYRESGLRLDALALLERMLARDPEDEELVRWRAALCEEMGLTAEDASLVLTTLAR